MMTDEEILDSWYKAITDHGESAGSRYGDIRPSQIYRWRRDLQGAANMVPVVVTGQSSEPAGSPTVVIEVQGATVRVMAGAAGSLVTAVLRALRR